MPSTSSLSSFHLPSLSHKPSILFFLRLLLAISWKNFVFRSPHLTHSALDLWFHIISFRSVTSFISFFSVLISSTGSWSKFNISNCCRRFCFSFRILFTLPNTLLFQVCRLSWQHFSLSQTCTSRLQFNGSQASSITFLHPSSLVHIASNMKRFLPPFLLTRRLRDRLSKQWSNTAIALWYTFASLNIFSHFSFATILSNLTRVRCSPILPLHQV